VVDVASAIKVKLVPWDDPDFVRTFEAAAQQIAARGLRIDDPAGALALQAELRRSGYPNATCYCERTVDEALQHTARCVVQRDGAAPSVIRPAEAG
jgi:hypothetical protein